MTSLLALALRVTIDGVGLEADVSKYIQSIAVTSACDSIDTFQITVANPYPDMRWTHTKDAELFDAGKAITLDIGYSGGESFHFLGEITKVDARFPTSGNPTLEVGGHSILHRLKRKQSGKTFKDSTDKQIVEKIAADYGLTVEAKDTKTIHAFEAEDARSDWEFLLELARRNNYDVLADGKTLVFQPRDTKESTVSELVWGKSLQSFTPSMNTDDQVTEVVSRGWDRVKKELIVGRYAGKPAGGKTGAEVTEKAFGRGKAVVVSQPVASQEEADRRAEAEQKKRAAAFLTGSGSTIGQPALRAGRIVALKGLGRFDGTYRLTRVTHTLGGGGYTTTFTCEHCP